MACGILIPRPGIEPVPPAVEVWCLNQWTAREVLDFFFFFKFLSPPCQHMSFSSSLLGWNKHPVAPLSSLIALFLLSTLSWGGMFFINILVFTSCFVISNSRSRYCSLGSSCGHHVSFWLNHKSTKAGTRLLFYWQYSGYTLGPLLDCQI